MMVDLTDFKLTFDDEFNARSISQNGIGTTWSDIRPEWRYDANSDIGFGHSSFVDAGSGYDPFNVAGGALSITAVPDQTAFGYPGSWESGLISTKGTFSQTYGYFEMRAQTANALGSWDAFWMLPDKPTANQELDVMEHYGNNNPGTYSTIHTSDNTPSSALQVYSQNDARSAGYHTYGMDWEPDRISFYVDGKLMGSQATPSDMHSPMYLLADLATENNSAGGPITTTIDYIRAFSKDPTAKAVAQDTVSAPDGADPGLYGATTAKVTESSPGVGGVALGVTADDDNLAGTSNSDTSQGGSGSSSPPLGNQGNTETATGSAMSGAAGGQGNGLIAPTDNGNDLLYGTDGSDTIMAGNGNNTIVGGTGNSAIDSLDGADLITSGSGNDLIFGNGGDDTVAAGGGADTLVGGFGRDVLLGNQGDDIILGNQGDDTLFGGQGADTLVGGQGNDVLYGNQGDDVLYGNEGLNTFVFAPGDTDFKSGLGTGDTVMDFATGISRIDFASGPVGTATDFGSATTTAKDFASAQALAQSLIDGGDAYAFVANGTDGYLFTNGGSGTTITDAIKLAGAGAAGAVGYTDIAHGALT